MNKPFDFQVNGQITWVYTDDLDATAYFYRQMLHLDCVRDEGSARIFATTEKSFIGVCEAFEDRVVEPAGGMITILTDNVDRCYESLVGKGVKIDKPPHRLERFGIYSFFIKDPNGYVIEFQQFLEA
jgi:predicted enzyme related to lactoylglutathione lyase